MDTYCCRPDGYKDERQVQRSLNPAGIRFQKEAAARKVSRAVEAEGSPTKRARTSGKGSTSTSNGKDPTQANLFR
jgi:hypothetical protein